MRKLIVFMHTSLDGFVAGVNGEMDWIKVDEEIFEYAGKCTKTSDTALYGRVTYEMMESYWPTAAEQPGATKHDIEHSNWYNKVTKVVLSKTLEGQQLNNTKIVNDNVGVRISELKEQEGGDILIFGSPSAVHALTRENQVDEFWLFVNPIVLGEGIPLFKGLKNRIQLKLAENITFSSGVACLHYEKIS